MTRNRAVLQITPTILLLSILSCNSNVAQPGSEEFQDQARRQAADPARVLSQDYLRNLWYASDHPDWDVISGVIDLGTGGIVSGEPATWPPGYQFSVEVPPGVQVLGNIERPVGKQGGNTIEIQIHVPQMDPGWPPGEGYPAVFKLEPDGLRFDQPVSVAFCYPPWLEGGSSYSKFCFFMISQDPEVFGYSDLDTIYPGGQDLRKDIEFETTHFSRWGLENGGGGGGPLPPDPPPGNGAGASGGRGGRHNTYSEEPKVR